MGKIAKVRVRKRGKTYSYAFEAGKSENGKRKIIEHGGYDSQESAYDAGMEAFADWKHGNIGITSEKISVKEFLESWLENVAPLNVCDDSVSKYRFTIEYYILPFFNCTVQEVTPEMVEKWMAAMALRDYAKNTLKNMRSVLNQCMDYAIYPCKIIRDNPVRLIKVPKKAAKKKVIRHIISNDAEDILLHKYPPGNRYHIPLVILFHTGMRIGEVLGLTWENINFEKNEITVCLQMKYAEGCGVRFRHPKTEAGIRTIKVDKMIMDELRRWKAQQAAYELKAGDSYIYIYEDEEHGNVMWQMSKSIKCNLKRINAVCTSERGKIVSRPAIFSNLWKNGINSHSFRHTHATVLIENGAIMKDVANRLGQKREIVTHDVYIHETEKMKQKTVDIFEKTLKSEC